MNNIDEVQDIISNEKIDKLKDSILELETNRLASAVRITRAQIVDDIIELIEGEVQNENKED